MTAPNKERGTFGKQDVGPVPAITAAERHRAALTVAEKCPDDAALVLAMLGLADAGGR